MPMPRRRGRTGDGDGKEAEKEEEDSSDSRPTRFVDLVGIVGLENYATARAQRVTVNAICFRALHRIVTATASGRYFGLTG